MILYLNANSAHQSRMLANIMNMRWSEYIDKYKIDGIFCYDPRKGILVTIYEGTGLNLLEEDEEAGYKDYWNINVGTLDTGFDDGGTIYVTEVIRQENPCVGDVLRMIERNDLMIEGISGLCLREMLIQPFLGNSMEHKMYEKEKKINET